MLSLVYVSSAIRMMNEEDLLNILQVSYQNNAENNITGMLVYKGGNFMQILEGPDEAVWATFGRIQADQRHGEIIVLSKEEIEERQFADWKMAFVNMDDKTVKNEIAFSDFMKDDLTADLYRKDPQMAHIMLLSFRDTMR